MDQRHTFAEMVGRLPLELQRAFRLATATSPAARWRALKQGRNAIVRYNLGRKIDRIYKSIAQSGAPSTIDAAVLEAHQRKWSRFESSVNDTWYRAYAMATGIQSPDFVPEDIYTLHLEPVLNDFRMGAYLSNKALLDMLGEKDLFPSTLIRNIDGFYYDAAFAFVQERDVISHLLDCDRILVKPSLDSGGGKNIELFERSGQQFHNKAGDVLTAEYLRNAYRRDFIIQDYIEQLDYFARLNASSVNTLRVHTYRSVRTDEVSVMNMVLRIGGAGSVVDNFASGGVAIAVDASGRCAEYAVDKLGRTYRQLPANATAIADLPPVPQIEKIQAAAKRIAAKRFNQRLLGVDVCVTANAEVKVIEVNSMGLEINFHQFCGGPLFHDKTDEIIDHCAGRPRSESVFRARCIYI